MSDTKHKYMILRGTPTPVSLSEVFQIIISESENGCVDKDSTMQYFARHYPGRYHSGELFVLVQCLNFDSVRKIAPSIISDTPATHSNIGPAGFGGSGG